MVALEGGRVDQDRAEVTRPHSLLCKLTAFDPIFCDGFSTGLLAHLIIGNDDSGLKPDSKKIVASTCCNERYERSRNLH